MKKISKEIISQALTDAESILAKLAEPNTWCRGDFAEDAQSYSVNADDPLAVRWCLHGFIQKFSPTSKASQLLSLEIEKEVKARYHVASGIVQYNDNEAKDKFDIMVVMFEVRQALYQKTLPWYHWYKWLPRSRR